MLTGMAGSRMPIVTSHGEGRAEFASAEALAQCGQALVCVRYADNYGAVAEHYPANPNGSPQGVAGLTSRDGRVTIMMPPSRARLPYGSARLASAGMGRGLALAAIVRKCAGLGRLGPGFVYNPRRNSQRAAADGGLAKPPFPAWPDSTVGQRMSAPGKADGRFCMRIGIPAETHPGEKRVAGHARRGATASATRLFGRRRGRRRSGGQLRQRGLPRCRRGGGRGRGPRCGRAATSSSRSEPPTTRKWACSARDKC